MSSAPSSNENKPGVVYRVSNVAFDLVTLGVFTGRYKHGKPNAWTSDGCSCVNLNADGTHKPRCTAGAAQQQASLDNERK
jgi:hypothetical protein